MTRERRDSLWLEIHDSIFSPPHDVRETIERFGVARRGPAETQEVVTPEDLAELARVSAAAAREHEQDLERERQYRLRRVEAAERLRVIRQEAADLRRAEKDRVMAANEVARKRLVRLFGESPRKFWDSLSLTEALEYVSKGTGISVEEWCKHIYRRHQPVTKEAMYRIYIQWDINRSSPPKGIIDGNT